MASSSITIARRHNVWQRIVARLSRDLGAWLYVAVVLGLVSALAFVYLAQASYVAGQIDEMAELERKLDLLHEENNALLLRISRYEDMSRIQTEARAMGLGEAQQVEYVVVVVDDSGPVQWEDVVSGLPPGAVRGTLPSASLQNEGAPTTAGLGLAATIAQQFQGWIGAGTYRNTEQPSFGRSR